MEKEGERFRRVISALDFFVSMVLHFPMCSPIFFSRTMGLFFPLYLINVRKKY